MIRYLLVAVAFLQFSPVAAADSFCDNDIVNIKSGFDGARLDHCVFTSENSVRLSFRVEDEEVGSAFAWFAFHVAALDSREIEIEMLFPDSYARFWPKISQDGTAWSPADETAVVRDETGKTMTLKISVDQSGRWVSAQELLTQDYYEDWFEALDEHAEMTTRIIGQSHQQRPIRLARTADRPEAVVLIGRQHPGEVPGAMAMREFLDVVLETSKLATEFRRRYMLIVLPLMNPDGVANGHARHNAGLADINRDWGPFTQPETSSVATLLDELADRGIEPRLMLDFHATKMSPTMIFYTQVPEDDTDPPLFATNWLTRVKARLPDFEFTHDPRTPSGLDNTKNYFFSRYGIPAITYELGDEIERHLITEHTPVFAEEMMRVMLQAETR